MNARGGQAVRWTLIAVTVLGLAIDAFVHFDLASAFQHNRTSTLSEADLFRAEAAVALVAAVALLLRPRRYTAAFAFVVALAGTAAVVVYRYVDIGAFGPFPDMYDPFWAPAGKNLSVIGEAVATVTAFSLFVMFHRDVRVTSGAARGRAFARDPQRAAG
jgi:hypothetical protein